MGDAARRTPLAGVAPEDVRPLRRSEYERLVEAGCFAEDRIELLGGVLVEMSPQDAPHSAAIERLTRVLVLRLRDRAAVRIQLPLAVGEDSEPEPDVAVVPPGDHDEHHPSEAWLVVEVAGASLAKDRGAKASIYAASSVPEYWIVNLADRQIEVLREPDGGAYTSRRVLRGSDETRLVAFPDVAIHADEIVR